LEHAQERVSFLVRIADEEAGKRGESGQPFSNTVWKAACEKYKREPRH
jgi:hypothetical protein